MSNKQYAVLGLGKFGMSVAEELSTAGADVLAVDLDEDLVYQAKDFCTYAVKGDICDTAVLGSLGLHNMDAVVVAVTGNLQASVIATLTARELGVPYILAKSSDAVHTKILEKIGADRVIVPEKESGVRVARSIMTGHFLDFIELSERVRMIELAPKQSWVGKSLRQLDLRKKERINVIAIRRADGEVNVSPDPDTPLSKKCTLMVTVDRKDIARLTED